MAENEGFGYQLTSESEAFVEPELSFWHSVRSRTQASEQFADCTLSVGPERKEIPASRLLLTVHSDFFKHFFEAEGDLAKDSQTGRRIVPLPDLDGKVVGALVEGLLSSWVYVDGSLDALGKLFHAVDFLALHTHDSLCLRICRDQAHQTLLQGGKKALAAYLVKLASLAERYNRTWVTNFILHLVRKPWWPEVHTLTRGPVCALNLHPGRKVTEDPEVWELHPEPWPSTFSAEALGKLRLSQKLLGANFPRIGCAMFLAAEKCECFAMRAFRGEIFHN